MMESIVWRLSDKAVFLFVDKEGEIELLSTHSVMYQSYEISKNTMYSNNEMVGTITKPKSNGKSPDNVQGGVLQAIS